MVVDLDPGYGGLSLMTVIVIGGGKDPDMRIVEGPGIPQQGPRLGVVLMFSLPDLMDIAVVIEEPDPGGIGIAFHREQHHPGN